MSEHIYNLKKDPIDERDYKINYLIDKAVEIPRNIDLSSGFSEIKNQGTLGACTAFSACSAMEYLLAKDVDLSELYFYFKEREVDGTISEDCGSTIRQSAKTATKIGACEENLAPYIVSKFAEKPNDEAEADAQNHKVKSYYRLSSIDEILYTVGVLKKPVLIGVDVYDSFETIGSNGKVPMPNMNKERYLGGHAINICGYAWNETVIKCGFIRKIINKMFRKNKVTKYDGLYFKVRNSWGKSFADKGYMYITADFLLKHSHDWWYLDI